MLRKPLLPRVVTAALFARGSNPAEAIDMRDWLKRDRSPDQSG